MCKNKNTLGVFYLCTWTVCQTRKSRKLAQK